MNEEKNVKQNQGFNQVLHDIAFGKTKTTDLGESEVKPRVIKANLKFNSEGKIEVNSFLKPSVKPSKEKETVKLWRKVGVKRRRRLIVDICDKETVEQTIARLVATESYVIHARTKETIIGTSGLARKRIPRSKCEHLRRIPRVNYHTRINASLTNGKFVVENLPSGKKVITFKGNTKNDLKPYYKPTAQYKTVWYSKGQRRQ